MACRYAPLQQARRGGGTHPPASQPAQRPGMGLLGIGHCEAKLERAACTALYVNSVATQLPAAATSHKLPPSMELLYNYLVGICTEMASRYIIISPGPAALPPEAQPALYSHHPAAFEPYRKRVAPPLRYVTSRSGRSTLPSSSLRLERPISLIAWQGAGSGSGRPAATRDAW